jgi:hypothetical protein
MCSLDRGLRADGERRKSEIDRENDHEPDQPHAHLGGDDWRESSRSELWAVCLRELAALVEHVLLDHLVSTQQQ